MDVEVPSNDGWVVIYNDEFEKRGEFINEVEMVTGWLTE